MPEDHEQIVVRRKKLQALRERGVAAYPNDFRPDHTAAAVHAHFGPLADDVLEAADPVAVAGRIMAMRDFGKAAFRPPAGPHRPHPGVRAAATELGDEAFEQFRLLDLGDIVGVEGRLFRTRPAS